MEVPTSEHSDPQTPSRRPYRSSLREERAADTRARITRSARDLFAHQGFAATTVAAIAKHAGVAAATVYATYGSKAAIVAAMIAGLEAESDRDGWASRIQAEPDPRRKLGLYASFLRALYSSDRGMWAAAINASSDPSVLDLHDHGERQARERLAQIVVSLDEAGELAAHLTREDAVDRGWMLTALELYFRAIDRIGWTDEQYEGWLAEALVQQLSRRRDP